MELRAIDRAPSRRAAVGAALLVTFLWSTSWVLIKVGLSGLPPLTFAALRYGLAALLLWLALLARPGGRRRLAGLRPPEVARLALLGAVLYAVTQGAQFVGLRHLPAATLSLALGFTPALVALASWALADERLRPRQVPGVVLALAGGVLYLGAPALAVPAPAGVAAALIGLGANAASALLGRRLLRAERDPLVVTAVSMAVGALLLAAAGAAVEPVPRLDPRGWAIVGWLAAINTALAFFLWNRTLRTLTATESSVLNNTMAIQIPVLAWVFLGEALSPRQAAGLALAAAGTWWFQTRR